MQWGFSLNIVSSHNRWDRKPKGGFGLWPFFKRRLEGFVVSDFAFVYTAILHLKWRMR